MWASGICSPQPSSLTLPQSDANLRDTSVLDLSKHSSNLNGIILLRLKVRVKTCKNVSTHSLIHSVCAVQGALNEGRTGPFVKTPAMRKRARWGVGMGLGGKCQLKRWEHFFFSSFLVWHLLHNGPFSSR